MRFLISAGEASGELYGAGLMEALRRRVPDVSFFGVGGQRMRESGLDTIVDAHQISVVGLAEVVKHLPMIRREFNRLVKEAAERKPDAAILIDFPDFNLRLARELHKLGIPVIYYVSPQLWAWREGRVKQVKRYVRKMLVIFPFEEAFYHKHGVEAEYVGHPLADVPLPSITREQFAAENGLDPSKTWVSLLPGSRRKEFLLNFHGIMDSANQLGSMYQYLMPVASSLDQGWVTDQIAHRTTNHRDAGDVEVRTVADARAALAHSCAAIVASGTATVEAALIGTPFVMIYRVTPLTYALGRRLVKLQHFAMPNLIAGRAIVPEFVQDEFVPTKVAATLRRLLVDGQDRQIMLKDLEEMRSKLHTPDARTATDRAAAAILACLGR